MPQLLQGCVGSEFDSVPQQCHQGPRFHLSLTAWASLLGQSLPVFLTCLLCPTSAESQLLDFISKVRRIFLDFVFYNWVSFSPAFGNKFPQEGMEVIDTGESHPVSAATSVTVTCSGDNGKQGGREGNHLKGHEYLPTRHIPPPHHVSTSFASYKTWLMARFSVKSCHTASAHTDPTLSGFLLFVVWTMPFQLVSVPAI